MFAARLAAVGLALLVLVSSAQARPARITAPTGLHGFLLRADEPSVQSFARTPSFAWNPVPGARYYQFQLSVSSSFREDGLVYEQRGLTTPVVAPSITLPWITGNPHSLYARVRAITSSSTTPWSRTLGFDVVPPAAPVPEPSFDGLLRWTPVEGADAYEVWLVDVPKREIVFTNVLDEREFYTFHRTAAWVGQVRWRVRALRVDKADSANPQVRLPNALPASTYGPWSPVYSSTNGPDVGGPIRLVGTVSDVTATGDSSPAHRLMPAFVFTGDQSLTGTSAELFRVMVFTDRQCLNRVYTSSVVGGPAYAPRPFGSLPLPVSDTDLVTARQTYIVSAAVQPNAFTFDGDSFPANESMSPATATTAVPVDSDTNPSGNGTPPPTSPTQVTITGTVGAPIDLPDTSWPEGGYYWTVVPVVAVSPGSLQTTVAASGAAAGGSTVSVVSSLGFQPGDTVQIGSGPSQDSATITSVGPGVLNVAAPLKFAHGTGDAVVRSGGNLRYVDLDLAQDACAAGRVQRFGISSEPSLVSSGALFASGLSSTGRLTAGTRSHAFYGSPLVAWTPALGADVYEIQWSKRRSPFTPQPDPGNQNALGRLTLGTSAVLPLAPGTWYYRVRGFDYSLPSGAQAMSWSTPARIVVAKPKFKVVGSP